MYIHLNLSAGNETTRIKVYDLLTNQFSSLFSRPFNNITMKHVFYNPAEYMTNASYADYRVFLPDTVAQNELLLQAWSKQQEACYLRELG